MPTRDIRTRLTFDGEREYKDAIDHIYKQMGVLNAEMKTSSERFKDNADSTKALTEKGDILGRQLKLQWEKLREVSDAYEDSAKLLGENADKTLDWQKKLEYARADVLKLERAVSENNDALLDAERRLQETGSGLEEYSEATDDAADTGNKLEGNLADLADSFGIKLPGSLNEMLGSLGTVDTKLLGVAGTAAAVLTAIGKVASETMDYVDEINTMAAVSGLSTQTLQEFSYMADIVDVSQSRLVDSTKDLTRHVYEAADGNEEYMDSFRKLQVPLKDSRGQLRDMEEIYWDVIYALADMDAGIERDGLAMSIMGEGARELNPMLNQTSAGLEELRSNAEEAGYVLDEKTTKNVQKFKDKLDETSATIRGSFRAAWGELTNYLSGDLSGRDLTTGLAYDSRRVGHNAGGTENWQGGLSWVGERGPELLYIPKASTIYDHEDSTAMMSGGGDTFNISLNLADIDGIKNLLDILDNYKRAARMGKR